MDGSLDYPFDSVGHYHLLELVHGVDIAQDIPEIGLRLVSENELGNPGNVGMVCKSLYGSSGFLIRERGYITLLFKVHNQSNYICKSTYFQKEKQISGAPEEKNLHS